MATTLNNAKLTVRVIEEINLNGSDRGRSNKHEIFGINEISERIMTVPTSSVTILSSSYSVGAGTFVSSSLKYIRMTNLDDTNFVRLSLVSSPGSSVNTAELKLEPKRTLIFTNTSFSGSASDTEVQFDTFSPFAAIKGVANSSPVDIELFIAST